MAEQKVKAQAITRNLLQLRAALPVCGPGTVILMKGELLASCKWFHDQRYNTILKASPDLKPLERDHGRYTNIRSTTV
jgi:hypothetical protein